MDAGDVYQSTHSGWYSVSDETFFAESGVEKRDGRMVAVETGNEVSWEEEENWKFRMSRYRDRVADWLNLPTCKQYIMLIHLLTWQLFSPPAIDPSSYANSRRWTTSRSRGPCRGFNGEYPFRPTQLRRFMYGSMR